MEAGILARKPSSATKLGWAYPVILLSIWAIMAFLSLLGPGVALVGLLFVWLGISDDPPAGNELWLSMARLIFVSAALTEIFLLTEAFRSRYREAFHLVSVALTAAASAVAFVLLRSSDKPEPWGLTTAILALGVLAVGVFVVSVLSKPRVPGPNANREPPRRGPQNDYQHHHYRRTRDQVMDILIRRGLLKVDEADRQRLRPQDNGPCISWMMWTCPGGSICQTISDPRIVASSSTRSSAC